MNDIDFVLNRASFDATYYDRVLSDCPMTDICHNVKLHRGSFEGQPKEYSEKRIICGVKSFAFDEDIARKYASRDPKINPNPDKLKNLFPEARGVLFTVTLLAKTKVLVLKQPSQLFRYGEGTSRDYFSFERTELFPIVRHILRDNSIAGYVTNSDLSQSYEAILDLERAYARVESVSII